MFLPNPSPIILIPIFITNPFLLLQIPSFFFFSFTASVGWIKDHQGLHPIGNSPLPLAHLLHLGSVQIFEIMVDLSGKGSEAKDANNRNPNGDSSEESPMSNEQKKTCADCGTTKTPLWRGGPAGPKSLCNACGIRSRKKKRAILGMNKGSTEEKKGKRGNNNAKIGESLKQRLMALGREVLMQRSTVERQRKKLGEEEQAAVLLMALSYGSVYA